MRRVALLLCAIGAVALAAPRPSPAADALDLLATYLPAGDDPIEKCPSGWRATVGKLTGGKDAAPLSWNSLPDEFELDLGWSVDKGGAIKLQFAGTTENDRAEFRLSDDPGLTIRLPTQARSLKIPDPTRGARHAMTIRRLSGTVSLIIDGVKSRELPLDAALSNFTLQVESGQGTIDSLRLVSTTVSPPSHQAAAKPSD